MIMLQIQSWQLKFAQEKAAALGVLNNSITNGGGNLAGYLGEIVLADYAGLVLWDTYDWDCWSKKGYRFDVKTKRRKVAPLPHYDCSVADYNPNQKCDVYAFVSVNIDDRKAWLLGWEWKHLFYKRARFVRKGEYDPTNDWNCSADCYSLPISALKSF